MSGVESFHDLLNESRFPRSDAFGNLARDIVNFVPSGWTEMLVSCENVNNELSYENFFPNINLKLVNTQKVTVRIIKSVLTVPLNAPSFAYETKLGLDQGNFPTHNPFVHLRRYIKMPRDRFFKFRILHGDVFCNERRFKFKMSDSPCCEFCGELESVKHLIWNCNRSRSCWEYFNQLTSQYNGSAYATYETVTLGSSEPNKVLEEIVLMILRMIISIDRTNAIEQDQIKKAIKNKYSLEKLVCNNNTKLTNLEHKWSMLMDLIDS